MTGPVRDFVLDTTTAGGTGSMTLDGNPPLGFKGFDAYPDGAVVYYARRGDPQDGDAGKIETGRGTIAIAGTVTLTRDQVFESSNNDELVNWSEGAVSHVFVFVPAAITGRLLASNAATARPPDLPPRGTWLDIAGTPWIWKLWDGTNDIVIGRFDPSAQRFTLSGYPVPVADSYLRRNGANDAYEALTPTQVREDLGGNAAGDRTVSTELPSGGADGDIWLQYG